MVADVLYRRGGAPDVAAMHALDVVCFEEPFRFSLRAMRRFATGPKASVWVAAAGGQLVGFVIVEAEGERGYVVTLDVAPEYRRGGVAGELMRLAEEGLAGVGVTALGLHVFVGNVGAVRFYEGAGFLGVGGEKDFYGDGLDAWVFRRDLGASVA